MEGGLRLASNFLCRSISSRCELILSCCLRTEEPLQWHTDLMHLSVCVWSITALTLWFTDGAFTSRTEDVLIVNRWVYMYTLLRYCLSCKIFTSHKWPIQYLITYKKVFLSFQVSMMLPLELAQLLKKWCLKLKHESPHLIRFWKAYPSVHCSVKDAPCLTVVKWPSRSRSCMLLSRHAIFSCLDWRKGKQTQALNQC